MKKFLKENAIGSTIVNLVMNTLVNSILLWNAKVVFLKVGEPNLLPNIIGPIVFSALLTTIGTYFFLTTKRKSGEVDLPINPNTSWFLTSFFTGLVIAFIFAVLAFMIVNFVQKGMENIEIPKITVIILSVILGTFSGLITSFIAAKRAAMLK
jgi:uncharacterized YccA/Bax inhibitor family protein